MDADVMWAPVVGLVLGFGLGLGCVLGRCTVSCVCVLMMGSTVCVSGVTVRHLREAPLLSLG